MYVSIPNPSLAYAVAECRLHHLVAWGHWGVHRVRRLFGLRVRASDLYHCKRPGWSR